MHSNKITHFQTGLHLQKRRQSVFSFKCLAVIVVSMAGLSAALKAQTCTAHLTTSTFSSYYPSTGGGATLCLAPGNYGSLAGQSNTSMVTITPDTSNGGTQTNVTFSQINIPTGNNLEVDSVTIAGGTIGSYNTDPTNITLRNIHWTGALCIYNPVNTAINVTIDGGDFTNIGQSCTEGRLGINGENTNHTVNNGITIKNVTFSGSGPSDGIQINGSAQGTIIGPGNIFTGIVQGGCGSVHCDAIQFYGAQNTTVTGNFFYGDSDAIMSPDCNGSPMYVTNNVFVQEAGSATNEIVVGGGNGDIFDHNTFSPQNSASARFGNPNNCGLSANETITNNVFPGGVTLTDGQSTNTFNEDYNLITDGGIGAHTIKGSPIFVGGISPTTYAGFALASSSPGHLEASNGEDIGINIATGTAPTAPAGLSAAAQ